MDKGVKILTLDRFESHDRLDYLKKKDFEIGACCQDMIDKRPFGSIPFYIFAHARSDDNGVDKRLIWQPRLTKPKAQVNSMLFKGYPGTDRVDIIWMIPAEELWPSFEKGKMLHSEIIEESINYFKYDRHQLEKPEPDDLPEDRIRQIYREISARIANKPIMPAF